MCATLEDNLDARCTRDSRAFLDSCSSFRTRSREISEVLICMSLVGLGSANRLKKNHMKFTLHRCSSLRPVHVAHCGHVPGPFDG